MDKRVYSQEELDAKLKIAKDDITYRVTLDNRLDDIEASLAAILKLPIACKKEWRSDILWFCGVPAGVCGGLLIILKLTGVV